MHLKRSVFGMRFLVTALAVGACGCGLLLDTYSTSDGGGQDTGVVADAPVDAGARLPPLSCGAVDEQTVALYAMDDPEGADVLDDASGAHPAPFIDGAFVAASDGPCGPSFDLGESVPRAASIADSAAFQLPRGSIDFLVRPRPGGAGCRGILSRDASGPGAGHLSIVENFEGRIGFRLQSGATGENQWTFTAPLDPGCYHFVALNFGGGVAELYIDGVRQTLGMVATGCAFVSRDPLCSTCDNGIDGNANPWALGVGTWRTVEGGLEDPATGELGVDGHYRGLLDEVRISSEHRDYEGFVPVGAGCP